MTRRKLSAALGAAALGLGAYLHGALSVPELEARGTVAGHALSGPVDSEIARDYLEGRELPFYLQAARRRLLADPQPPSRGELAEIARRYSPDVATLLFIEAIGAAPENGALQRRFEAEVKHVRRIGIDHARPELPGDLRVLLVPGWFYRSQGRDNGADLGAQRHVLDRMGIEHRLIAVEENGAVSDNARIVADVIRRESTDHRLLIVSASKGGPEVALALGHELSTEDTRAIVGWLSIGGVVRGTPFADRVLEPDLCWLARLQLGLKGFDLGGARSMQTAPSREAFDSLRIPPDLPVVSYVATPLSGHISERGSFGYSRMRQHGPNDGLTLLADEVIPGARSLLAPGVDHFFHHEEQDVWTAALVRVLLEPLADRA